jgi:hypothetical protein
MILSLATVSREAWRFLNTARILDKMRVGESKKVLPDDLGYTLCTSRKESAQKSKERVEPVRDGAKGMREWIFPPFSSLSDLKGACKRCHVYCLVKPLFEHHIQCRLECSPLSLKIWQAASCQLLI